MTRREPLHLDDSPKNRRYAEGLRAEIVNAIARQAFRYEDYFPNSRIVTRGGPAGAGATIGSKLIAYKQACELAVKRGNMSAATLASYRKVVDGKLIPKWGETKLRDLTTADLREWLMLQEGTRKTFNNMLIPLRAILDDAATDEIIDYSPLAKLPLDRILDKIAEESTYQVNPFSAAEVRKILSAAGDDRTMFQFAFFTGCRTSEYIALDWASVNLQAGTATIDKARVARVDQARTKTRAGMRTLELTPPAIAALQAQRAVSQLAGGKVFLLNGQPWHSDKRVNLHWRAVLKRAEVEYRNPYQTRHTFATMQLALGEVALRVAYLLGHADTEMVNRHYTRWIGADTATVRAEWLALHDELGDVFNRRTAMGGK